MKMGHTAEAYQLLDTSGVPEISRFFGIVIRMFTEAGGQHHAAHFHAPLSDV